MKGLRGGHSGSDIDKGLGNATRYSPVFSTLHPEEIWYILSEIAGGNLHNAIPREANAYRDKGKNKEESG